MYNYSMMMLVSDLLEAVVYGNGQDTADNLCNDVGDGIFRREGTVVPGHDRNRRVEVPARYRCTKINEYGQSCTDHPGIASGDNDGEENEGSQKFNEDRQEIHCSILAGDFYSRSPFSVMPRRRISGRIRLLIFMDSNSWRKSL